MNRRRARAGRQRTDPQAPCWSAVVSRRHTMVARTGPAVQRERTATAGHEDTRDREPTGVGCVHQQASVATEYKHSHRRDGHARWPVAVLAANPSLYSERVGNPRLRPERAQARPQPGVTHRLIPGIRPEDTVSVISRSTRQTTRPLSRDRPRRPRRQGRVQAECSTQASRARRQTSPY